MFRFADPTYLYLFIILPFIAAFYFYSNYRRRKNILKFGDPELVSLLMPDVSKYRPNIKFWLTFSALALAIFLLARPPETVPRHAKNTADKDNSTWRNLMFIRYLAQVAKSTTKPHEKHRIIAKKIKNNICD